MFAWVCPTCGKELDVSVTECPECKGRPTPPPAAPPAASRNPFRLLLALVAGVAVVGVVGLVRYQSRRAPVPHADLKPAPALEAVPESAAPTRAPAHQVEVAGVRLSYDERDKPQARAVLINHGEEELRNVTLAVTLRSASAKADAPPLGRFTVRITGTLKAGDSREVRAPLEALATLAAMPPWRQMRADVELK